jgi:hypothetical protein
MIDYSEVEEGKVTGQQHLALRIITNLLSELVGGCLFAFAEFSAPKGVSTGHEISHCLSTTDFALEKLSLEKMFKHQKLPLKIHGRCVDSSAMTSALW